MEEVKQVEKGNGGKVYVLDGFVKGAVSGELFYEVLEQQETFLSKLNFAVQNCFEAEEDEAHTALYVIEDLCEVFKREGGEFEKKGEEEEKATGGKIDVVALKEQGIPDLVSGAFDCQYAGLNPATVLSNAIKKIRGERQEYPLVYAFSPKVFKYFSLMEIYIKFVNTAAEDGNYEYALEQMRNLVDHAEDIFESKRVKEKLAKDKKKGAAKIRGKKGKKPLVCTFSPKVMEAFNGIDEYIENINDAVEDGDHYEALKGMRGLHGHASYVFNKRVGLRLQPKGEE